MNLKYGFFTNSCLFGSLWKVFVAKNLLHWVRNGRSTTNQPTNERTKPLNPSLIVTSVWVSFSFSFHFHLQQFHFCACLSFYSLLYSMQVCPLALYLPSWLLIFLFYCICFWALFDRFCFLQTVYVVWSLLPTLCFILSFVLVKGTNMRGKLFANWLTIDNKWANTRRHQTSKKWWGCEMQNFEVERIGRFDGYLLSPRSSLTIAFCNHQL